MLAPQASLSVLLVRISYCCLVLCRSTFGKSTVCSTLIIIVCSSVCSSLKTLHSTVYYSIKLAEAMESGYPPGATEAVHCSLFTL